MTSLPAERMGLVKRGRLAEGFYGDVNVFDPEQFEDHATFERPTLRASGLYACIVNGQVALYEDVLSEGHFGQSIRRERR